MYRFVMQHKLLLHYQTIHMWIIFIFSFFLITFLHHSVCTALESWNVHYNCVSLFVDMFESMPEQSPTTETKAATTPSVDLFGSGTGG